MADAELTYFLAKYKTTLTASVLLSDTKGQYLLNNKLNDNKTKFSKFSTDIIFAYLHFVNVKI